MSVKNPACEMGTNTVIKFFFENQLWYLQTKCAQRVVVVVVVAAAAVVVLFRIS